MRENKPFILGKIFNNPKYAEDLLDGKVFVNPLASFGIGNLSSQIEENLNRFRGDLNEGLLKNVNPDDGIPVTFFQDIGGIPSGTSAIGEIDSRFFCENIYCLTAIFYDRTEKSLKKLDKQLLQFDDKGRGLAVVIYNKEEFIRRISNKLSSALGSLYWFAYGLVDYDFEESTSMESDEFTKELSYSYQQEFRIAINLNEDNYIVRNRRDIEGLIYDYKRGTLVIDIGSIRDIAFSLPVTDYVDLSFPEKFKWIKTTEPSIMTNFYPPLLNKVSYIYPLLRVNGITFISENGMYPRERKVENILINYKQLSRTKNTNPSNDCFFLSIFESYFLRILDICKARKDTALINKYLTGLLYYMMFLRIMNCAGMNIALSDKGTQSSYSDLEIHDYSLIDRSLYDSKKTELTLPKPTDFAILLTLSDQEHFEEYEYNGKRYVRVKVDRDGVLTSGEVVKKGDAVWVEASKVRFKGY